MLADSSRMNRPVMRVKRRLVAVVGTTVNFAGIYRRRSRGPLHAELESQAPVAGAFVAVTVTNAA
jgi:hypothetical protein